MAYPRKDERNREIVRLRDIEGWTFPRIAEKYELKKHSVFGAYRRQKAHMELSTENA